MKSKFEQFVADASSTVEVTQSHNEYLNEQTENLIKTETRRQKIAKSFVKMGVMASLIAMPIFTNAATQAPELATSKYQSEMQEVVKAAQEKGYFKVSPEVAVKEVKYNGTKYDHYIPGVVNQLDAVGKSKCDITITLSDKGHVAFMAHDESLKELTKPQNAMQEKLTRQFLILHEASHCELNNTEEVFLIKGNPGLQRDVNYYFKHMLGTDNNDSAYNMLQENFADTYAAMQLIKNFGATPDVMKVLTSIAFERQDRDIATTVRKVDSHYTHFSLMEALTQENVDTVLSSGPDKIKQLALEIANKGTNTVLSTYADNLPAMFEINAMVNSTFLNFTQKSMSAFFDPKASHGQKNLMSENTSYFKVLGTDVFNAVKIPRKEDKKLGVADLTQEQAEKALQVSKEKFLEKHEDDFPKIEQASKGYIDYIKTFKPMLAYKASNDYEKYEELKKENLNKYLINMASFEKSDKNSVVKSIQTFRDDSTTNALKIK